MKLRVICLVILAATMTYAATIDGLHNTGAGLAGGASDTNWAILSPSQDAVVLNAPHASWLVNTGDSQWIWQTATGTPINVTLTFRLEFVIEDGFDPSTAFITGRWATDNAGLDILINGNPTGQTSSSFTSWTSFVLASGFVAGANTIDFVVQDVGTIAGFRAEFQSSNIDPFQNGSSVPEPGTWLLLGTGILLTGIARQKGIWVRA